MLFPQQSSGYFFYNRPVDMRKSFDGLYLLVVDQLASGNLDGKIFVFVNKRKDKIKIFYFDKDGFVILYKRLEKGTFRFPSTEAKYLIISSETLALILYGIDLKSVKKLKRFSI